MKILGQMVGMSWRHTTDLVSALPTGEPLILVRDPDNEHDGNAVQVWHGDTHIAFIKREEVRDIARHMDSKRAVKMPARLVFISRQAHAEVEMP
jgi:hypothetical protein